MPQEPAVIYDQDSGWYGHVPARLRWWYEGKTITTVRCLSTYTTIPACLVNTEHCVRCETYAMYDVVHYRPHGIHEVETQEAALKPQQVFDHPGAGHLGTARSGGAGDLLPGELRGRCLLHTARGGETHGRLPGRPGGCRRFPECGRLLWRRMPGRPVQASDHRQSHGLNFLARPQKKRDDPSAPRRTSVFRSVHLAHAQTQGPN